MLFLGCFLSPGIAHKKGLITAVYLARLIAMSDGGTVKYYTDKTAAEDLNISPRKIAQCVKDLEEIGVVKIRIKKMLSETKKVIGRQRSYEIDFNLIEKFDAQYEAENEKDGSKNKWVKRCFHMDLADLARPVSHDMQDPSCTDCKTDLARDARQIKESNKRQKKRGSAPHSNTRLSSEEFDAKNKSLAERMRAKRQAEAAAKAKPIDCEEVKDDDDDDKTPPTSGDKK
ncbi:MAG: hypothetical protein SPL30_04840 [Succinivibrio sp.]|nr:hypothetical protein [Succinivibrio sp.]